jgi:transcriptional regulator with XRE-family HTH domain
MTNPIDIERSNVMLTKDHISFQLQKYKAEQKLSLDTMAQKLNLPRTSLQDYLKGRGNPRSDTIDLIVDKIGLTLPEMFAEPPHSHEQAVHILQAAGLLSGLPEAQREQAVQLFLAMVSLFN